MQRVERSRCFLEKVCRLSVRVEGGDNCWYVSVRRCCSADCLCFPPRFALPCLILLLDHHDRCICRSFVHPGDGGGIGRRRRRRNAATANNDRFSRCCGGGANFVTVTTATATASTQTGGDMIAAERLVLRLEPRSLNLATTLPLLRRHRLHSALLAVRASRGDHVSSAEEVRGYVRTADFCVTLQSCCFVHTHPEIASDGFRGHQLVYVSYPHKRYTLGTQQK